MIPPISRRESTDRLQIIIIERYHEQDIAARISQGTPAEGLLPDGFQQVRPAHLDGLGRLHSARVGSGASQPGHLPAISRAV